MSVHITITEEGYKGVPFVSSSTGANDADKGVTLNESGLIDKSLLRIDEYAGNWNGEEPLELSGSHIDVSLANVFLADVSQDTTFTLTGWPEGLRLITLTLSVANLPVIDFPGVTFDEALNIGDGLTVMTFESSNGGVDVYGYVLSQNHAPVFTGAIAGQAVNDNATINPFAAVSISDADNSESLTVTVVLDSAEKGAFTDLAGFIDNGDGNYSFTGTVAESQDAIRGLVFSPVANRVPVGDTETTNFSISVSDGAIGIIDNVTTVISTSVNDAPIITGAIAGQTVNDNATINPFAAVSISDADNSEVLMVRVTLDLSEKGTFTDLAGFTDNSNGVFTFLGSAAESQDAIRNLVFTPTANRTNPGGTETTTFTILVDDGSVSDENEVTTVITTSVNDAPTLSGMVAGQAVNDNATISPFSTVLISDADTNQTVTVTITHDDPAKGVFTVLNGFFGNVDSDEFDGTYTFSGAASESQDAIRGLVFTPVSGRVAVGLTETSTFTINVDDTVSPAVVDSTTTVISTAV